MKTELIIEREEEMLDEYLSMDAPTDAEIEAMFQYFLKEANDGRLFID